MIDNKNIVLAVVLSIIILVGFDMFFAKDRPAPPPGDQPRTEQTTPGQAPGIPAAPSKPGTAVSSPPEVPGAAIPSAPGVPSAGELRSARKAILEKGPRVAISTPSLHGSINLTGGGIDDLSLVRYRETLDPTSPEIVLLIPKDAEKAYYAEFGWVASDGQPVPGPETPWRASRGTLSLENPVTLTWDNGQGLKFSRTYAVDENFMFTVSQKVLNTGAKPATLYPYGLLSRRGTPEVTGFYILHEGLMGVF
ncbi:MAG TPA: YidC/Oxa1 family membrane protein insertase, partial [Rhodospirillales bacterium]|nr:YidC/Oxa1 family membrane protein insertase [Rhodospirillales bacterium]